MTTHRWPTALLGLLMLVLPVLASAQEPVPTNASFAVRVIQASRGPSPKVDPRLADLERELRTFQRDYNQFTLVREQALRLNVGGRGTVKLPDGADFAIQLLGFTPGKVQRVRHVVELPRSKMTRAVAPGGQTLDVVPDQGKLTIVSTRVGP